MTASIQIKGSVTPGSMTTPENLAHVTDRMKQAARRAGRNIDEITLIAVTKGVELKKIKEAIAAGVRVFGENYVQEAAEKIKKTKRHHLKWHFIGHLQKNKAKLALELFDMIQTVDSVGIAKELSKRAKNPIDVLIEVNLAGEKTKAGIGVKQVSGLVHEMAALKNLNVKGLIAIPPYYEDPEMSRPFFVTLRRLAERINRENIPGVYLNELSIGMSHDFDVAIEEGATMVRIGTAIFGERKAPQKKGTKKGK
jgi:pyridoxal phosphate enzyme (YggS family)